MNPGATTKLLASTMVFPGDAVADETDVGDRVVTSCRIHDTTASDGGIEERRRRRWLVGRVQLWRCDLFWFFDLDRR